MLKRSIISALLTTITITLVCALQVHTSAIGATGTATPGAKVYSANCSACHGAEGAGTPGTFPPLADNTMVTGSPDKVIAAVKNGLNGETKVNGKTYNGTMPAWKDKLSNADIAAVITYIRSSWGNKAGAVTEEQVCAAK